MGGPRFERAERFFITESGADPVEDGELRMNAGVVKFKDLLGIYNPRSSDVSPLLVSDNTGETLVSKNTGEILETG